MVEKVNDAKIYSVQLDTTQDVSSTDICSIIIRTVTDEVNENLLAAVPVSSSTGAAFLDLLKDVFEKTGVNLKNCVGNSTDGASNMRGIYKGFSANLSKLNPWQVHVWCYAHVLNLVIADAAGEKLSASSLFSNLNKAGVFIKESYKRMNVWKNLTQNDLRRIGTIGKTRWTAKQTALSKIFGCYGKPGKSLFVSLILFFENISTNKEFRSEVRVDAKALLDFFLKKETILTGHIFLRIFKITTFLSKYLQTDSDAIKISEMMSTIY